MPGLTTAGIIAAGEGSRLTREGIVKPLIPVAGAPLCHWVARSLKGAGITDLALLHNSRGRAIEDSLRDGFPSLHWTFWEADTASSWESFRLVARSLARMAPAFLISTVDCLIPPAQARRFVDAMADSQAQAGLALTDFVDDEKPLWADLDESGRVTALGASAKRRALATAGVYYLTAGLASKMAQAAAFESLRAYLGDLVASGQRVAGLVVDKTLDVDRPQDLRQAERFLRENGPSW